MRSAVVDSPVLRGNRLSFETAVVVASAGDIFVGVLAVTGGTGAVVLMLLSSPSGSSQNSGASVDVESGNSGPSVAGGGGGGRAGGGDVGIIAALVLPLDTHPRMSSPDSTWLNGGIIVSPFSSSIFDSSTFATSTFLLSLSSSKPPPSGNLSFNANSR